VSTAAAAGPEGAIRAPALAAAPWREARFLREPLRRLAARSRLAALPHGDGLPVLVLPGMHVADWSTRALRRFLVAHGFDARGWGLGWHRADVSVTLPRALARLEQVAAEAGRPVALVGWSLGGVIARELARLRPDLVDRLFTLGTPVVGGPRCTAVAYAYRGHDLDALARLVAAAERAPIRIPVTAIWSRRDGIVAWRACLDETTPGAENVEVTSSHWGLGLDPDVFAILVTRLVGAART
jgi:alpha-beta hydrolase superfamily lysophospholipase